jgi:plastocyanin
MTLAGRRGPVTFVVLSLALAACSSKSAPPGAGSAATSPAATATASCASAGGLSGPLQDHGFEAVQNGTLALDAGDTFFAPTCVRGTGTVTLTVRNTGSALHNFSVTSLKIDKDVPVGQTITLTLQLPASGTVAFFCKYHVSAGMQGAFIAG